jgi:hypothetical protein
MNSSHARLACKAATNEDTWVHLANLEDPEALGSLRDWEILDWEIASL